jgi:hypothetical protein
MTDPMSDPSRITAKLSTKPPTGDMTICDRCKRETPAMMPSPHVCQCAADGCTKDAVPGDPYCVEH